MNKLNHVIDARDISKEFADGERRLSILKQINFQVSQGARVAIIGASGSGKSTLLHILSGLDNPDTGEVLIQGESLNLASPAQRGHIRNRHLGFVYQFHHLLSEFTALDNVAMPLMIRGITAAQATEQAQHMLNKVGLSERLQHKPAQLSGGERQRAAIARALVTAPACVLADEPTGNLDYDNAEGIFELLLDLNKQLGMALVIVTHDRELAQRMDVCWRLTEGQLHLE